MIGPAATQMTKYGFRIRTRSGTPVDNLAVWARDQAEAERKLNQIYPHCEIIEWRVVHAAAGEDGLTLDNILTLIARQPDEPDKG